MVVGADSVSRPKPHPDLLMKVMAFMHTDESIMIGDTISDLEMARAAGVCCISVACGHHTRTELGARAPVAVSFPKLRMILKDYQ